MYLSLQFLSECVVGAPVDPDGETETEEEERMNSNFPAFQVVGSISDQSDENGPYVLEEYLVSISSNKSCQVKWYAVDKY